MAIHAEGLTWTETPNGGYLAFAGMHEVGSVTRQDGTAGLWNWSLYGVEFADNQGKANSHSKAKDCLVARWVRWRNEAGLTQYRPQFSA